VLIDTNLLVRTLQPHHELYPLARKAIDKFRLEKRRLYLVPQNFVEMSVFATRPIALNGLGMRFSDLAAQIELLNRFFTVLPETEDIFPAWERLVVQYQVVGKPAHDARLVAAMQVHGLAAILTFD
jgi:predicted nucleic acid-binding protein